MTLIEQQRNLLIELIARIRLVLVTILALAFVLFTSSANVNTKIAGAGEFFQAHIEDVAKDFEGVLNDLPDTENWEWSVLNAVCDKINTSLVSVSEFQGRLKACKDGVDTYFDHFNAIAEQDSKTELTTSKLTITPVIASNSASINLQQWLASLKETRFAGKKIELQEWLDANKLNNVPIAQIATQSNLENVKYLGIELEPHTTVEYAATAALVLQVYLFVLALQLKTSVTSRVLEIRSFLVFQRNPVGTMILALWIISPNLAVLSEMSAISQITDANFTAIAAIWTVIASSPVFMFYASRMKYYNLNTGFRLLEKIVS